MGRINHLCTYDDKDRDCEWIFQKSIEAEIILHTAFTIFIPRWGKTLSRLRDRANPIDFEMYKPHPAITSLQILRDLSYFLSKFGIFKTLKLFLGL